MRKIIRRLLRYAYNNGITEPFLAGFVPDVLNLLGKCYDCVVKNR